MRTDVVVDLETWGTGSNAVIVSIGLAAFDLYGFDSYDTLDTFYTVLERQEQIDNGGIVDAGTVEWWFQQGIQARAVYAEPTVSVVEGLGKLNSWVRQYGVTHLWGNGATFDNVILENLYKRSGIKFPFKYFANMDMRTIVRLANDMKGFDLDRGIAHHALDDAKYEALKIQAAYYRIFGANAS